MTLKSLVLVATVLCTEASMASLALRKVPPEITLDGKNGGRVKGGSWSSKELLGKVNVLFYVAPSAKDLNKQAQDALKKETFPSENFASTAVVNMKASFAPNFLISRELSASQKENPRTIYVEDKTKELVTKWNLADNSSDIIVFNKEGQAIFSVDGKLSEDQISEMLKLIKTELAEKPAQQPAGSKKDPNSNTHRKN